MRILSGTCAAAILFAFTSAVLAQAPAGPGAAFRVCARIGTTFGQLRVCDHHRMLRTIVGNGPGDPARWDAPTTQAYRRAWEGLWHLDVSNHAIWIDESTFSDDAWGTWLDSDKVVSRANNAPPHKLGTTQLMVHLFSDCLDHLDIYVDGPTMNVRRPDPVIETASLAYLNSCVSPTNSPVFGAVAETNVLQHELGHGYGYDHFNGWITIMNTFAVAAFSCELGTGGGTSSMLVTPDAYLNSCHDIVYGVRTPADRDISVTPVFQPDGCNLADSPCSTIEGRRRILTAATTAVTETFRYTTLMNHGAIDDFVFVGTFLSKDRVLDAADVRIDHYVNPTDWQPGSTIRKERTVTFDPRTAMPDLGVPYFVLVKVDHTESFIETSETNNVTDLGWSFVRR